MATLKGLIAQLQKARQLQASVLKQVPELEVAGTIARIMEVSPAVQLARTPLIHPEHAALTPLTPVAPTTQASPAATVGRVADEVRAVAQVVDRQRQLIGDLERTSPIRQLQNMQRAHETAERSPLVSDAVRTVAQVADQMRPAAHAARQLGTLMRIAHRAWRRQREQRGATLARWRRPRAREMRCPACRGIARSADSGGADPPGGSEDEGEIDKPGRGGRGFTRIAPLRRYLAQLGPSGQLVRRGDGGA